MARKLDGTILIVDDDGGVREALRDTLEDAGYRVGEANDGAEALAWLRSHPPPALIFLDWNMVPMNAPKFIEEFRKEEAFAQVPVVLMTADMHAPQKVNTGPYHGYIMKPVNLDTLFDVIGRVAG